MIIGVIGESSLMRGLGLQKVTRIDVSALGVVNVPSRGVAHIKKM